MTRTEELVHTIQTGQTRAVVARIYAQGIADCDGGRLAVVDWPTVNRAALTRWTPSGLEWIKARAWKSWKQGLA